MWMKNNSHWLVFLGMAIIMVIMLPNGCDKKQQSNGNDTIFIKGKPIVNNYEFTNPTLVKEKVIIYDSTKKVLTKRDSDLIVIDYLKNRIYQDSIVTDTTKIRYTAEVEKNHLKDIKITYKYEPKQIKITEYKYQALYLGLSPAITNQKDISLGMNFSYAWKFGQVGIVADPFKRNYYLSVSKRLSFK